MNNFNFNPGTYPQDYYNNPWAQNISPWPTQPRTNKILVTSLDEAIAKTNERNSEMYYWDQSKPIIYVVRTDLNGVKTWAQLPYNLPNQDTNTPATKADVAALAATVDNLTKKIELLEPVKNTKKKKLEVAETEVENAESNG